MKHYFCSAIFTFMRDALVSSLSKVGRSCTESESKLVIKHLLKCFFLFYHCNTNILQSNILYISINVFTGVSTTCCKHLHTYAGVSLKL
uniref:Uncharacterized protein n=1 Tax=Anguilla anguilla TaxID=7936 RepID=A0A0E9XCL1_ANGAN